MRIFTIFSLAITLAFFILLFAKVFEIQSETPRETQYVPQFFS